MTRTRTATVLLTTMLVPNTAEATPIKNMFGTDGVRGIVARAPFTVEDLVRFGYALGTWACERYGQNASILIAHDTRISCSLVKSALQAGLLLHPVRLYDAHVLPTPVVYYLTRTARHYDCGIIITASHNPYTDNGIKIVDSKGGKLCLEDELALSTLFARATTADADYNCLGLASNAPNPQQKYYDDIKTLFPKNFLCGRTIVLDCAHGATYQFSPELFTYFGANVIAINNQPTGKNINEQCGAVHTQSLQDAIREHHADAGFAFDGDGDRVIAVNRHGEQKDGDDILALLVHHPTYHNTPTIVGTLMSNQGFEVYLENMGKNLIRANVGDKYVAQQLEQHNLLLGGEQSGHIIMRDFLETGDGTATALKILETITLTNNWDMVSFNHYPQVLINIPVTNKLDLATPALAAIIENEKKHLISGRVLVRYSGTENKLRIMVEDETIQHAQSIANNLATALGAALNTQ